MKNYRIAFSITLTTTLLLAGLVAFLWFYPSKVYPPRSEEATVPPSASHSAAPAAPSASTESAAEPKLVPVTLTPERMQSIGVKTGTVAYREVHDEIRTTGNVEVDETRLADVQVR